MSVVEISDRAISSTRSAEPTTSIASLAVNTGAVSRTTTSNRSRAAAITWRCAATTCDGFAFGSCSTLVTIFTPGTEVVCTVRGRSSTPNNWCTVGRRKSQFTTSTEAPDSANTAARLALVLVLPSRGDAEVTMTTRHSVRGSGSNTGSTDAAASISSCPFRFPLPLPLPVSAARSGGPGLTLAVWKSTEVLMARNASATRDSGAVTETMFPSFCCARVNFGTSASTGSRNAVSASVRVRIRWSRRSNTSASATPARRPRNAPKRPRDTGSSRVVDELLTLMAPLPSGDAPASARRLFWPEAPRLRRDSYSPLEIGTASALSSLLRRLVGGPSVASSWSWPYTV